MIFAYFSLLIFLSLQLLSSSCASIGSNLPKSDVDLLEFPLNLEYMEAEFFLWGSFGHGLDSFAPELADGGPSPIGATIAKLSPLIRDVIMIQSP
ncbi:hypothetical protein A4A49_35700 [Nicotiana attenuata]|uniref:Uncharacterized protein n=1 Tax=Nicotiana attenuata TaxID=49451 RepID=A0A1J6K7P2_NICAT|nr:hypothetical protein A4A49_35700 [Nicotiana attenuata]